MTKQQFIKHLTRLVELKKAEEKITSLMRKSKLKDDFNGSLFGVSWYEDLAFNILKDAVDDKYDWLGYWLYENNCGNDIKKDSVQDSKGKNIKLKTISDLYNCIVNDK